MTDGNTENIGGCVDCGDWEERDKNLRCPDCAVEYLRRLDMFAAAALTGLLGNSLLDHKSYESAAAEAWASAVAMLKTEPQGE